MPKQNMQPQQRWKQLTIKLWLKRSRSSMQSQGVTQWLLLLRMVTPAQVKQQLQRSSPVQRLCKLQKRPPQSTGHHFTQQNTSCRRQQTLLLSTNNSRMCSLLSRSKSSLEH